MAEHTSNNTLSSDEESIDNETINVETTTEKKHKMTFNEFVTNHIAEFDKFKAEFDEASIKDFYKLFQKFIKNQETFNSRLIKMHERDRATRKSRKSNENTGKSGFNKPTPVPKAFRKYLELEDDVEMTRPQIVAALHTKFKEDNFKNGSEICLSDKKVAKIFNVEKNHTFLAKDFHSFIKNYYTPSSEAKASANA